MKWYCRYACIIKYSTKAILIEEIYNNNFRLMILKIITFFTIFFGVVFIFGDTSNLEFIIFLAIVTGFIAQAFIWNKEHAGKRYLQNSEWRELREKVLIRDNYRCNKCKCYPSNNKPLHIHHIIERCQWWEDSLDNLIALCQSCHNEIHSKWVKSLHANTKRKIIETAINNNQILHIDYRAQSIWGIWTNSTRKIKPEKFYSENGHYYMYWFCYLDNDYRYFRVSRIIRFHE